MLNDLEKLKMNTKHTPEPWTWTTHGTQPGTDFKQVPPEDYKRAMECVNAMEGIHDPQMYINVCKDLHDKLQNWSGIVQRSVDIIKTKNSNILNLTSALKSSLKSLPVSAAQKNDVEIILRDLDDITAMITAEELPKV